jgi:hypothetical protein
MDSGSMSVLVGAMRDSVVGVVDWAASTQAGGQADPDRSRSVLAVALGDDGQQYVDQ